jgi:hypothetical protein
MRIDLGTLKALVREAAMTAVNVPADVGLIIRESTGYVTMALIKLPAVKDVLSGVAKKPHAALSYAIIGGITAGKFDVWRVTNVKAARGHGPLLYRLAMQYATNHGSALSSDPQGSTSADAQNVWDKFAEQEDVETIFLDGEHGDQRDIAYRLEGDDSAGLSQRYTSLLAQFDQRARDGLDDILDGVIGEAIATFG